LLSSYIRCPVRAGFERDRRVAHLRRMGLRAALGVAAHGVLERKGIDATFQDVWNQQVATVYAQLRQEWAPAVPPSPTNWPGWALTVARLSSDWLTPAEVPVRRANGVRPVGGELPKVPGHAKPGPLPWREVWLEDSASGMAGRPDVVTRSDGALRVIDFKTGLAQKTPTESQKRQLLFYSSLVQRALDELPTIAAVQDTRGGLHSFPVVTEEVVAVREQAREALRTLQEAAAGVGKLDARPNEENCSICPFRVVCGDFLTAYKSDWKCSEARVGEIRSITLQGRYSIVDVNVLLPAEGPAEMRLVGFPFPRDASVGQVWGFSEFEGTGATGVARWNTLVMKWANLHLRP